MKALTLMAVLLPGAGVAGPRTVSAGGEAAAILDLADHAPDPVALLVEMPIAAATCQVSARVNNPLREHN